MGNCLLISPHAIAIAIILTWCLNLVQLHEIDVTMEPADFRWQIDNQDTQYDDARDMNVTYITFDGERFAGGHFKVHGARRFLTEMPL
jgi:hypothetical protein